MSAKLQMWLI